MHESSSGTSSPNYILMLQALSRAQLQLQWHRSWLRAFARSQIGVPHATATFHIQQSQWPPGCGASFRYASTKRKVKYVMSKAIKGQSQTRDESIDLEPETDPVLLDFRSAIEDLEPERALKLYLTLPKLSLITRRDFSDLARCLHEAHRREKIRAGDRADRETTELLVAFAERIVKDVQKGELIPDRRSFVRLIGLFKESGVRDSGIRFWQWLEQQDDAFVDADVYGAAIELLAVDGVPLADLETLYQRALQRFPGYFNSYHFSPNAILPDRDLPINIKGLSVILMEGIIFARLVRGNSRDAYLGLDTILRLYPDITPPRLFHLFVDERPINEAYTVFEIACRAGTELNLPRLLKALRSTADDKSPLTVFRSLRAMLSAMHMYLGAGGQLKGNMVNEMVIAMTQILRQVGVADMQENKRRQVVDAVLSMIRKMIEVAAAYGARPGVAAFNSIITNVGGHGREKKVLGIAMKDMQALGIEPTIGTWRCIIILAGMSADGSLMGTTWRSLASARTKAGQRVDATDLHILVTAAVGSNDLDFAREAVEAAKGDLSVHEYEALSMRIERLDGSDIPASPKVATNHEQELLFAEIEKLQADLAVMEERTRVGGSAVGFREQTLPMTLVLSPETYTLPEAELRKLYDELTLEQRPDKPGPPAERAVPGIAERKPPTLTKNNMPFGQLRYENWKTMNYLLALAEKNDAAYHKAVDDAIAAGVAPPPRERSLGVQPDGGASSHGISDVGPPAGPVHDGELSREDIDRSRNEILRLRGRLR